MLTLRAGIKQIPPDNRGGHDLARDEIEQTAETYEDARSLLYARVEDEYAGWRVIYLQTVAGGPLDAIEVDGTHAPRGTGE